MSIVIQPDTLDRDAYYRALESVAAQYQSKGKDWIDNSRERVFDVRFTGLDSKGRDRYVVLKNSRLDKASSSRLKSYTVIDNHGYLFCNCNILRRQVLRGITGNPNLQIHQVCTHIGAVSLFKQYTKEVFRP